VKSDEIELLRVTVREVFANVAPEQVVPTLLDLGITDAIAADRAGVVGVVFEEQGRALAGTPLLNLVLGPVLVDTASDCAVVLPPLTPGATTSGRLQTGSTLVEGIVFGEAPSYLAAVDDGPSVVFFVLDASAVTVVPVGGVDPDLGLRILRALVTTDAAATTTTHAAATTTTGLGWHATISLARRALGHELIGVADHLQAVAIDHVTERHQFGQPIGAFQTVKHRLAESYVQLTAARRLLDVAWEASVDHDDLPARVAKAQAGKACLLAARHAQQVCGAIGFTWEHGLHRAIRRAHLLDAILGPAEDAQIEIGRALLRSRSVARLGTL
jgi:hypothetical protein